MWLDLQKCDVHQTIGSSYSLDEEYIWKVFMAQIPTKAREVSNGINILGIILHLKES